MTTMSRPGRTAEQPGQQLQAVSRSPAARSTKARSNANRSSASSAACRVPVRSPRSPVASRQMASVVRMFRLVVDDQDARRVGGRHGAALQVRVGEGPYRRPGKEKAAARSSGGNRRGPKLRSRARLTSSTLTRGSPSTPRSRRLDALLDDRAHAPFVDVARPRDARRLPERGLGRQVRDRARCADAVTSSAGIGPRRVRVLLVEPRRVRRGAVAQLLRGGPEVRSRRRRRVVALSPAADGRGCK